MDPKLCSCIAVLRDHCISVAGELACHIRCIGQWFVIALVWQRWPVGSVQYVWSLVMHIDHLHSEQTHIRNWELRMLSTPFSPVYSYILVYLGCFEPQEWSGVNRKWCRPKPMFLIIVNRKLRWVHVKNKITNTPLIGLMSSTGWPKNCTVLLVSW